MGTVEEEADETMYWMDLLTDAGLVQKDKIAGIYNEADQLVAITVASIKTAKTNS